MNFQNEQIKNIVPKENYLHSDEIYRKNIRLFIFTNIGDLKEFRMGKTGIIN